MPERWLNKTPAELADIIFNEDEGTGLACDVAEMYQAVGCGYLSDEVVPALDALCEAVRQLHIAENCLRENADKLTEIRRKEGL